MECLVNKYSEKFSRISSDTISNEINLNSSEEVKIKISKSVKLEKKDHWANRDFFEYIDAA